MLAWPWTLLGRGLTGEEWARILAQGMGKGTPQHISDQQNSNGDSDARCRRLVPRQEVHLGDTRHDSATLSDLVSSNMHLERRRLSADINALNGWPSFVAVRMRLSLAQGPTTLHSWVRSTNPDWGDHNWACFGRWTHLLHSNHTGGSKKQRCVTGLSLTLAVGKDRPGPGFPLYMQ